MYNTQTLLEVMKPIKCLVQTGKINEAWHGLAFDNCW